MGVLSLGTGGKVPADRRCEITASFPRDGMPLLACGGDGGGRHLRAEEKQIFMKCLVPWEASIDHLIESSRSPQRLRTGLPGFRAAEGEVQGHGGGGIPPT